VIDELLGALEAEVEDQPRPAMIEALGLEEPSSDPLPGADVPVEMRVEYAAAGTGLVVGREVRRVGAECDEAAVVRDGRLDARALAALTPRANAHALAPAAPPIEHEHVRDALRVVLDVDRRRPFGLSGGLGAVLGRAPEVAAGLRRGCANACARRNRAAA
jgi:hypothetical protein